jgi:hypothetical protein
MQMYTRMDVQIHVFPTSALVGGEWSASRTGRLTRGETAHGTHLIGDWVGPRAGLDDVEKILDPAGTRTPTPRPSSRYTDCATRIPRHWSSTDK